MTEKLTIDSLYGVMFETLQALRDKDKPMDIERAMAIKDVAQVIINTAKVEVDHMRVTGGQGSGFIPTQSVDRKIPQQQPAQSLPAEIPTAHGTKTVTQHPSGATVTRHKMY